MDKPEETDLYFSLEELMPRSTYATFKLLFDHLQRVNDVVAAWQEERRRNTEALNDVYRERNGWREENAVLSGVLGKLRETIKQAEWSGGDCAGSVICPWCGAYRYEQVGVERAAGKHAPDCRTFLENGAVR